MEKISNLDIQLSQHFSLRELVITSNRTIDNRPTQEIADRLIILAAEFLEPIRHQFGAIRINSGYRCPELNTSIGGSKTSAHMFGSAGDIYPLVKGTSLQSIINWIIEKSSLQYDQVILESSSTANWLHVGMCFPGKLPRKQALRFKDGVYSVYNKSINYCI